MSAEMIENANINFERMTTMAIKAVFSPTKGPLSAYDDSHHDLMIAMSSDGRMLPYSVASNSCRSRTMAKFIGTKL
jgi:hypothetical protein